MTWLWLTMALAVAGEDAPAEETDGSADADMLVPPPPTQTGGVERLEGLSSKEYRWLKPARTKMDPNPYQQVDFTAYTLEWGEFRVGVAGIQIGLLPRLQLGTQPVLDLIGIYNGTVKFDAVRAGPMDLGVTASYHQLPLGDFTAQYGSVGGTMSWVMTKHWSIHGGAQIGRVQMEGVPSQPPALFKAYVNQEEIDYWAAAAAEVGVEPYLRGEGIAINAATDFRLNRRDSIVVRGQAFAYGSVEANLGTSLPADALQQLQLVAPGIQSTALDEQKKFALSEAYAITVSYQASFRRIDLRLGGGRSLNPLVSALQANDLAVRFGGKTRMTERRTKRGWRRNRDDVSP